MYKIQSLHMGGKQEAIHVILTFEFNFVIS
jgi:hypothetical protein